MSRNLSFYPPSCPLRANMDTKVIWSIARLASRTSKVSRTLTSHWWRRELLLVLSTDSNLPSNLSQLRRAPLKVRRTPLDVQCYPNFVQHSSLNFASSQLFPLGETLHTTRR